MNANPEKSHRTLVSRNKNNRTIKAQLIGTWYAVLSQTSITTVEEWRGLSRSDAIALCESYEESYMQGIRRSYLGGVVVTQSFEGGTRWMRVDSCWGTKVSSQINREGDTNLYTVSKTTEELNVYAPTGNMEKL